MFSWARWWLREQFPPARVPSSLALIEESLEIAAQIDASKRPSMMLAAAALECVKTHPEAAEALLESASKLRAKESIRPLIEESRLQVQQRRRGAAREGVKQPLRQLIERLKPDTLCEFLALLEDGEAVQDVCEQAHRPIDFQFQEIDPPNWRVTDEEGNRKVCKKGKVSYRTRAGERSVSFDRLRDVLRKVHGPAQSKKSR